MLLITWASEVIGINVPSSSMSDGKSFLVLLHLLAKVDNSEVQGSHCDVADLVYIEDRNRMTLFRYQRIELTLLPMSDICSADAIFRNQTVQLMTKIELEYQP